MFFAEFIGRGAERPTESCERAGWKGESTLIPLDIQTKMFNFLLKIGDISRFEISPIFLRPQVKCH
jgi:hypothetical protein